MTSFLILHGWQNRRPKGHWQRWLASELAGRNHQVRYPQLPDPFHPNPAAWVGRAQEELNAMRQGERVVICHSLSCMAWLHLAAAGSHRLPVDRVVFVAPPSNAYLAAEPALTAFQVPAAWKAATVATSIEVPRLVCSDNDPYCKEGARHAYPVGFDVDLLPGAGHLDMPAGYGPWPSLLAWCLNPATRVQAHPQAMAPTVTVDHAPGRLRVAV